MSAAVSSSAHVFELRGVSKRYGGTTVLDGIDLEVPAGATVVLLGRSGCGKSTILRLLNGLLAPDAGAVRFVGEPVGGATLAAQRRRMGYVIQEGGLFPHLTVRGNLALLPHYLGWERPRVDARIGELLALLRLAPELAGRYPAELSGGQRQRVALARALVLDPPALLLDEPLGALDPIVRHELQSELRDLFAALARTVVLVTHDLAEAAHFGGEIVLLDAGVIVQRGPMRDLLERPATPFVERFVRAQRSPLA